VSFVTLLGFITLISIFRSPVNPLADSLVASMASRFRLDYGHMRLWGSIFFTISAISLGAVWQQTGFKTMFTVSSTCFIVVSLSAFLLDEPESISKPIIPIADRKPFRIDPGLLFLIGGTFLTLAAIFMASTFGTVYVTRLGGSAALVGALIGTAALGEVPGMLFGNKLARRIGDTNMLQVSYALIVVGLFGYTLSSESWALLFFALLRGIGFGSLLVVTVTIINIRAPEGQAATYQGILSASCWGLAPLLGGPLSGWIYQSYGPMPFFIAATGIAILAGVLIIPTYHYWKKH